VVYKRRIVCLFVCHIVKRLEFYFSPSATLLQFGTNDQTKESKQTNFFALLGFYPHITRLFKDDEQGPKTK
jgi:hypothetical protein